MYYTSRALYDAKERHPLMEKLAFALVTPLVSYLRDSTLSDGKEAIRKLKAQAA